MTLRASPPRSTPSISRMAIRLRHDASGVRHDAELVVNREPNVMASTVKVKNMRVRNRNPFRTARKSQSGMALIETVIALGILLVAVVGVMVLAIVAITTTENQGHCKREIPSMPKTKWNNCWLGNSATPAPIPAFPCYPAGGSGLGGCPVPLASPQTGTGGVGGSSNPATPVQGYVDYLDSTGNLVAANGGWFYKRVWQVSLPAGTTNLKQITVTVQTKAQTGSGGLIPQATVSALKTFPF